MKDELNHIELALTATKSESRVDTRVLAQHLGNQHKPVMGLIDKYSDRFQSFGQLTFKKAVGERTQGGGNAERFALLNEDQAYLLLNLSRNSDRVVDLKVKLIRAFSEARRTLELRQTEYLPGYHKLHDQIHALAVGSENEARVHMNVNMLINKVAGIASGSRATASLPTQSILVVAQLMASNAMRGAPDHRIGYQLAKLALEPLRALTAGSLPAIGQNG